MERFNRCIFVAGTSVLRVTPNVCVGATQTSDLASEDILDENIVSGSSLASEISNALLRDSVALTIRKGLATSVDGNVSLFPWSEGENSLLLHHNKIYVPEALHAKIIEHHHDNPMAGHFGVQKTLELVSKRYHWPLSQEVKKISQDAESH